MAPAPPLQREDSGIPISRSSSSSSIPETKVRFWDYLCTELMSLLFRSRFSYHYISWRFKDSIQHWKKYTFYCMLLCEGAMKFVCNIKLILTLYMILQDKENTARHGRSKKRELRQPGSISSSLEKSSSTEIMPRSRRILGSQNWNFLNKI